MAATVDPIRYAWEHCNPRVSFPTELGRPKAPPLATTQPDACRPEPEATVAGGADAAQALHAFVVGNLRPQIAEPAPQPVIP